MSVKQKRCNTCPLSTNWQSDLYYNIETDYNTDIVDVFFVGEAPGEEEAKKGAVFVGRSGNLLRGIIKETLRTPHWAIGNIVRCRPVTIDKEGGVTNRTPNKVEINSCVSLLKEEIYKKNPKVVILLGGTAVEALLNIDNPIITELRRNREYFIVLGNKKIPAIVTYHPSYILRNLKQSRLILQNDIAKCNSYIDKTKKIEIGVQGSIDTNSLSNKGNSIPITNIYELETLVSTILSLPAGNFVVYDCETESLSPVTNKMACFSVAWNIDTAYVVPIHHPESPWKIDEYTNKVLPLIQKLFREPATFDMWVGHNIQFDLLMTELCLGTRIINKPCIDTMLMLHNINEYMTDKNSKTRQSAGLKNMAQEKLGFKGYTENLLAVRTNVFSSSFNELCQYSGMDAYITLRLFYKLLEEAKEQHYLNELFLASRWQSKASQLCANLRKNGFGVNLSAVYDLANPKKSPLLKAVDDVEKQLYALPSVKEVNAKLLKENSMLAGFWLFDANKPSHLVKLFIEELQLKPLAFTDRGKPQINDAFLREYKNIQEASLELERRKIQKLFDTYIQQLLTFSVKHDDSIVRVHPEFWLNSTLTHRTACSNPNLQQLPKGKEEKGKVNYGKLIKTLLVPNKNNVLLNMDFSQMEVRWLAQFSRDPNLISAMQECVKVKQYYMNEYLKNPCKEIRDQFILASKTIGDFHIKTASMMFSIPPEKVDDIKRQSAKKIIFGLCYGKHYTTLAKDLNISEKEAESLYDKFFKQFPKAQKWLQLQPKIAEQKGYVINMWGNRRRVGFILKEGNKKEQNEARNEAMNSPIQGAASHTALFGASLLNDYIYISNKQWLLVNFVHDAIVLECPYTEVIECINISKQFLTNPAYIYSEMGINITVPLEIDVEIGNNYGNMKKIICMTDEEIMDMVKEMVQSD